VVQSIQLRARLPQRLASERPQPAVGVPAVETPLL